LNFIVELEWCGSYSFLFLATNYTEMQRRSSKLDDKCREMEVALNSEMNLCANLRKQLKQLQLAADDNIWRLEEQLAHASNLIMQERETNNDLRERLSLAEVKLAN
jgi:hypothetical protein